MTTTRPEPIEEQTENSLDAVRAAAAMILGIDKEKITRESRVTEDLNGDDLDRLEIVTEVESRLNVSLSDDVMRFLTIGELVDAVEKERA
jgi:acyl carrier protein